MKKLLFLSLLAVGSVFADLSPALIDISSGGIVCDVTGTPATCRYSYVADVNQGAMLVQNQTYFTLYDFVLVPDTYADRIMAPAGWEYSVQSSGVTPGNVNVPEDSAAVPNITFKYVGPTTGVFPTSQTINGFSAMSFFSSIQPGVFSSVSGRMIQSSTTPGVVESRGPVDVPGPLQGDTGEVPEPMSMGMLGGGLLAMGLLRLRGQKLS